MEGLRDIKGLVEVSDNSLFMLIFLIVAIVFVVAIIIYFLKRDKKRVRRRLSKEQIAKKELFELNLDDTKEAVYTFSKNIQFLMRDNSPKEFLKRLDTYRYKKDVPPLSDEDRSKIKEIIEELKDVKN